MPNKLKNLNITKVDLVPEGANPDAFVTMYKSKTPIRKSGEAESFADKLKDTKLDDVVRQIWQYTESLSSSLISILRDDNIIQSDIERMGAKGIMKFRQNKSKVIAEQMFIHQNKTFAQQYFKKGVWGTDLTGGTSASSSSTDFVSFDNDNSSPIKFIGDCITEIKRTTGRKPNKLGLGQRVFDALINHPDVMNRVIYGGNTASPAMVTTKSLAAILGVDEVVVFDAIWNSANLGEEENTGFICDENAMLLAYATSTPMIDEPTAGYTFRWDMGTKNILPIIEWEGDEGTYSNYIGGMIAQDMEIVCKDLGFYFQNAVTPKN
mgnify:CR=1 FL=1